MAIAAPVLERRTDTNDEESYSYTAPMSSEEIHNARISDNYARLINPETRLDEALGRKVQTPVAEPVYPAYATQEAIATPAPAVVNAMSAMPAAPVAQTPVYVQPSRLVESARTTADIFRADSAINARPTAAAPVQTPVQAYVPTVVMGQADDEEENEDLRPTQTTIQYKTSAMSRSDEEGKIGNIGAEKHFTISKREKITIGVIVGVIVALFTLIIINSAIISGINNDIHTLEAALDEVNGQYAVVNEQIDDYMANIDEAVEEYANANNMHKIAE